MKNVIQNLCKLPKPISPDDPHTFTAKPPSICLTKYSDGVT